MQDKKSSMTSIDIYQRLLVYVRPYLKGLIFASLAMVVVAATEAGMAMLMRPLMDNGFIGRDPATIILIPLGVIGLSLVKSICNFISGYGINWVGRCVVRDLRKEMFDHLIYAPSSYYDKSSSGNLLSIITFNAHQVATASSNAVVILIKDSLTFVFLLGVLFYQSAFLASAFVVAGPLLALVIYLVGRRFRQISQRIMKSMSDVSHVVEEAIDGYRTIKSYAGQSYERKSFSKANENNRQQALKMEVSKSIGLALIEFISALGLALVIYLATDVSMKGEITPGEFTSFVAALALIYKPIRRLLSVNAYVQRGIAASENIFGMIDCEKEKDTGPGKLDTVKGDVEYSDVSFKYETSEENVLSEISLSIKAGQTAAFVGKSGSGKTTLVNLLPRFYDIDSGTISIDGTNINDVSLGTLRRQIALVGQDITLFNDTIRNNLAYGELKDVSDAQILEAADIAHAMEFIREMPEGLDTIVGENGVLLSGGQRQRLAITRAILKNAPILILDEATSALDSESEKFIQDALQQLIKNRTTLVVAHRLSTIEKSDIIFVMDKGKIVESGTHAELIDKDGYYANFYRVQYKLDNENNLLE